MQRSFAVMERYREQLGDHLKVMFEACDSDDKGYITSEDVLSASSSLLAVKDQAQLLELLTPGGEDRMDYDMFKQRVWQIMRERRNQSNSSEDLDEEGTEVSESFVAIEETRHDKILDNMEEPISKRSLWPSSKDTLFNPTMNSSSINIANTDNLLPSPICSVKRSSHSSTLDNSPSMRPQNLSFETSGMEDASSIVWNTKLEDTFEGRGRRRDYVDEVEYDEDNNVFEIDKVIEEYNNRVEHSTKGRNMKRRSLYGRRDMLYSTSDSSSKSPSSRSSPNSRDSALPSYNSDTETLIVKRMLAMESRLDEIRESSLQSKHQISSLLDIVVNKSSEDINNTDMGQEAVKKLQEFLENEKEGFVSRIRELEKEIESSRREAMEGKVRLEVMELDKDKVQDGIDKMVEIEKDLKDKNEELEKICSRQSYELASEKMKINNLEEHIQFIEQKMEEENKSHEEYILQSSKEKQDLDDQRMSSTVDKNKLTSINTELINQRDELLAEKKMLQDEIEKLKNRNESHLDHNEDTNIADEEVGGKFESFMSIVSGGGTISAIVVLGTILVTSQIIKGGTRVL